LAAVTGGAVYVEKWLARLNGTDDGNWLDLIITLVVDLIGNTVDTESGTKLFGTTIADVGITLLGGKVGGGGGVYVERWLTT